MKDRAMALYVYALVEGLKAPPRARALGKGPLRLVRAAGFTALVSDAPEAGAAADDLEALKRHDRVVRAAHARARAVLPFRFGSTAESPRELGTMLRSRSKVLRQALEEVKGRDQLTLRLLGPARAASESEAAPRTSGSAYLNARAARERKKREVPELEPVRATVAELIRAERAERAEGEGPVRATVFHLVDRGASRTYLRRVKSAPKLPGEWRLFISGPGPAWAFGPEDFR